MMLTLARYELRRLLVSPLAWGLMAAWQVIAGLFFNAYVASFLQTQAQSRGHFSVSAQIVGPEAGVISLMFLLLVPILAMGSFAGERRAGSMPLLQSAPLDARQLVGGKYLGQAAFLALAWLMLGLMPLSLLLAGRLDPGQCLMAWLGLGLIGGFALAVAQAASAWCRHPASAAALSLAVLLPLWLVESATLHVHGLALLTAESLSLLGHFRSFREGLLDTGDIAYYLLGSVFALTVASAGLRRDNRRPRAWLLPLLISVPVFLGLLAASQLIRYRQDLSSNGWNSLSAPTRAALQAAPAPLELTGYFSDPESQARLRRILRPYQALRPDFRLRFAEPAEVERSGLPAGSRLVLWAGKRPVVLPYPLPGLPEQTLAPALAQLGQTDARWLVFVSGHGERDPLGDGERDLGELRKRLEARGLRIIRQSLAGLDRLPDNTGLLVLASPQTELPPADQELIRHYLEGGGRLLWLAEPEPGPAQSVLAAELGLARKPGTLIDPDGFRRGTPDPAILLVDKPEPHVLTAALSSLVALPWSAALEHIPGGSWQASPLLKSNAHSWLQTQAQSEQRRLAPLPGEASGAFTVAYALTRDQARVVVVGDGNFLSDGAIGNYGNAAFGLAAIDWLLGESEGFRLPDNLRVDPGLAPSAWLDTLRTWVFPWLASTLWLGLSLFQYLWRRRQPRREKPNA